MTQTVKQLAQLSGVSIRTLRYYDDIGLLKPAYYTERGYRCYEETQLLILQQILFFREVGMQLKDIKRILNNPDCTICEILKSHKLGLKQKIARMKRLITTIDKTIATLEGENKMSHQEMYDGFDPIDLPVYDQIAIDELGEVANKYIARRNEITKKWTNLEWEKIIYAWNKILIKLTDALHHGLKTDSVEVQKLIKEKYQIVKQLYVPDKEGYLLMIKINCHHPEYRKQYDFYDVKLANYLEKACLLFAENEYKS